MRSERIHVSAGIWRNLANCEPPHTDRGSERRYSLFLAEGFLRRGDRTAARSLIGALLETSRALGYTHFGSTACWLMGECLAPEAPASAEPYVETAMEILERIGARNDLARAMVTRAALRQAAGDLTTACDLLDQAGAIFHELGTLDEPAARRSCARRARPRRGDTSPWKQLEISPKSATYELGRRPRVSWIHEESQAIAHASAYRLRSETTL